MGLSLDYGIFSMFFFIYIFILSFKLENTSMFIVGDTEENMF